MRGDHGAKALSGVPSPPQSGLTLTSAPAAGWPSNAAALAPRANNSYQATSPLEVRHPELPGATTSLRLALERALAHGRRNATVADEQLSGVEPENLSVELGGGELAVTGDGQKRLRLGFCAASPIW